MKPIVFLIIVIISNVIAAQAQTAGTLSVTTTTSTAGGNYAPRNILAIWIEDEQGNWVKTLMAYAASRITHLNTWEVSTSAAGSTFNVVDAITGATKSSHAIRTCSWNGTDLNGNIVPDGTYTLRMELTDRNGTGNFSSFNFIKGANPLNLTPSNVPSFSSISIVWEPSTITVKDIEADRYGIYPNPTTGKLSIKGENIKEVKIYNADGKIILDGKGSFLDLSWCPDGIYYAKISYGKFDKTLKVILQK
jgi:hypothetical protein